MYPEEFVLPMKAELVDNGFEDLKTASEVESAIKNDGTTLVVINSVCGCSASTARPGVKAAVSASSKKPSNLATVFAGVDPEAVQKAREYTLPYPPSSPSIALFKDTANVVFSPTQIIDSLALIVASINVTSIESLALHPP